MRVSKDHKKKRVALWGAGIFIDQTGSKGIPSLVETFALLALEFDITIYSHLPLSQNEVPAGLRVRKVRASARRLRIVLLILRFIFDHFKNRFKLIQAHSSHPDPLIAVLLGKLFNLPVVVGYNAGEFAEVPHINFGALLDKRQAKINFWVAKHATVITAVSNFQAKTILRHLEDPKKISVIYRGVNLDNFKYQERVLALPMQFIHVAYLHPVKDQITLLRAFQIINKQMPSHLTIVGPDFWSNTIQNLAVELGMAKSITFTGHIPHAKLNSLFQESHVMLHTSYYEAIGVSVAEAMACGVVVCGTHVGIMADLSSTCCFTVPPGEYEKLAYMVLDLINDPEKIKMLRNNAINWIRAHDANYVVDEYKTLYHDHMLVRR